MAQGNPVGWFEIYVNDMERAQKFYETVLQISLSPLPSPDEGLMVAFPWEDGKPGTSGALVKHEMGKPASTGTMIYFSCEDCGVELGRVEDAGGKIQAPKFAIGEYGFCGLASDTEGNTIGFHSMN